MTIKIRKDMVELDNNDIILDNGACIQILTKTRLVGWNFLSYVIPQTTWKKIKDNFELTDTKGCNRYLKLKGEN